MISYDYFLWPTITHRTFMDAENYDVMHFREHGIDGIRDAEWQNVS